MWRFVAAAELRAMSGRPGSRDRDCRKTSVLHIGRRVKGECSLFHDWLSVFRFCRVGGTDLVELDLLRVVDISQVSWDLLAVSTADGGVGGVLGADHGGVSGAGSGRVS